MTSSRKISLGLDYGTNSARALFVDTATGEEIGCGVSDYASGEAGIVVDDASPHLARQVPADWERSTEEAVSRSLEDARAKDSSLDVSSALVGIGIDATASTPLPVDAKCRPLAESSELRDEHAALAWLWKDHTAHAEAEEITALAAERLPEHLDRCGGAYTSEWYFAKLLRCLREAPAVVEHAADWIEQGDWIAGFLTGCDDPRKLPRNVCAAGHKGFYHDAHGWPPAEFLAALDPKLAAWTSGKLDQVPVPAGSPAGTLGAAWADRLGLREGTPVSVAAIDAHVGAVGAGIRPGVLVKILGTSACDMIVHPEGSEGGDLGKIEGLSGIVRGSILPGHWGLEAGQSAVGDIFGWFVREFAKPAGLDHEDLTREAATLRPGETGLLALDWNNGNRSVLAAPLLSGLLVGQTQRSTVHSSKRPRSERASSSSASAKAVFASTRRSSAEASRRGTRSSSSCTPTSGTCRSASRVRIRPARSARPSSARSSAARTRTSSVLERRCAGSAKNPGYPIRGARRSTIDSTRFTGSSTMHSVASLRAATLSAPS